MDTTTEISYSEMDIICAETFKKLNRTYDLAAIRSKSREGKLVAQRRAVCMVLRSNGYTLQAIGNFINRTHCSVLHCINTGNELRGIEKYIPSKNDLIQRRIRYHELQILELKDVLKSGAN